MRATTRMEDVSVIVVYRFKGSDYLWMEYINEKGWTGAYNQALDFIKALRPFLQMVEMVALRTLDTSQAHTRQPGRVG